MKFCPQCQQTFNDLENVCPQDGTILYLQDLLHLVGCTIDKKYLVEHLAGIGGMSAVYRAYHREMDRPVALKILLPHLTLNDPEMLRMFEREARTAGLINHPNVATIYDTGCTSEEMVYLAMEWLEGHTLEKIIRQNAPLDWETVAQLLEQIVNGLTAAHQCRIIHRDLKPGNIMVLTQASGSMQVKILDFGIAKIAKSDSDNFVSTAVGTVHYASPEQMIPGNAIDARTDLYALGVMLYEMLTGRLPFEGESAAELIRQHLLEPPLPLSFNRPDAPKEIAELIEQMLAKKPASRPASAQEVWSRFQQAWLNTASRKEPAPATFVAHSPTVREIPAQYTQWGRPSAPLSPFSNAALDSKPLLDENHEEDESMSLMLSRPARVPQNAVADPMWESFEDEPSLSFYEDSAASNSPHEQVWEIHSSQPPLAASRNVAPEPVWESYPIEPEPSSFYTSPSQPGLPTSTGEFDLRDLFAAGGADGAAQGTYDINAIPFVAATNNPSPSRRAFIGLMVVLLVLALFIGWRRSRAIARPEAAKAKATLAVWENKVNSSSASGRVASFWADMIA